MLPPEEKTEFQKFVFTTTGQKLPIYGRNLFTTTPSTFAPVEHIPVPVDYVIGPGDELIIRVWGQVDFNARVFVDRNGQVYVPRVGTLNVAGVRYEQMNSYLKTAVSRVFKNFDLNVTLGQLRSIQIFVVGQARRPGTYTVSSLSTLVTALFASGGPNANGSMRHIQLKRQNQVVSEFDFYDLLGKGDKSKDVALLPGDVIYIPPVGDQVAIIGSVNLPAIYEIDRKTSIQDQIATAGGLSTTADGTRVVIERIDNRTTRSIREIKLDDDGLSASLRDGDIVRVFSISPRVEGSVILRGNVALPGRYPWHDGMHIADLIPSKDALVTRGYWMRQSSLSRGEIGWKDPERPATMNQARMRPDRESDRDYQGNDVEDGSFADYDNRELTSEGSQAQQNLPRAGTDRTRSTSARLDLQYVNTRERAWSDGRLAPDRTTVIRNPSDINWDYAVIQRLNPQDLSSELVTFDLGKALGDHASADNIVLKSGDVITIFSQKDLYVPAEKRTKFVWIEGEVNSPGVYRAQPGETLRDLVARAGGLTSSAYLFGAEFRRVSTRQQQQKEMDELIQSAERDLRSRARLATASLNAEDKLAGQQELQYESAAIEKLRTIQLTGRVILEVKPTDTQVAELPSVALEDGDRLIIPPKPATVGVVGAVYNQNSFLYEDRNNVAKYLSYAGGGTREADGGRLFIVRANGSVISKQMHRSIWSGSFESTKLFPGDAIVMPEKIKTGSVLRGLRDWSQVFAQLALGAAALKTLAP
jgi:protein involved in polysaccharide export with SLBB domain